VFFKESDVKPHFAKKLVSGLLLSLLMAPACHAAGLKVVEGLKMPESVAVAADGRIFVSEIGEFGKPGDGDVAIVTADGKVKPFATGLDDPKGLAFAKGDLYVADNKRIVKIGKDGKWSVFVAPEAFPATPQFLNDLVLGADGALYVSDSGDLKGKGGAVYRIALDGKKVSVVVNSDDPRVLAPNGLLADGKEHLLMVDFLSGILYRLKIATGKLEPRAEGFGGGDGIVRDKQGTLWVSDWKNGRVFSLKPDGTLMLAKTLFQSAADIGLSVDGKFILVPDMKAGTLTWLPVKQ
jgi:streptogramin lyase